MVQEKLRRKVIKTLAKGQVTIPREFREALEINPDTLLSIAIVGDHLEIMPLRQGQEDLRRYPQEEITRFLEEDKIDRQTADKVRKLIQRGEL
jgi:predicted nucleic acid-binding protein/bifunctional DNA-binding transcriptional regulator/antitoxin component of YhaV-PrlF toxin-antitoxin module